MVLIFTFIIQVDEEFIARYQLNYGFTEESKRSLSEIRQAEAEAAAKKEKEMLELKELKAQKRAAQAQVKLFKFCYNSLFFLSLQRSWRGIS